MRFSRDHVMASHVFWRFVACYLVCILCRNAFSESTFAKVFASINDTSEADTKSMFKIENVLKTRTTLDGITQSFKDNWSKSEIQRDSLLVKDASETKPRCSRYCIQNLKTREEKDNSFKNNNICISWFAGNQSEEVDFSLEHNAEFNMSRRISMDNKNAALLNNCEVYLDSNCVCNIINIGEKSINEHNKVYSNSYFNRQNVETFRNPFSNGISKFSKKLLHRTNLRGYTESNFHVDSNTTGIVINISGNITRVVLAIPISKLHIFSVKKERFFNLCFLSKKMLYVRNYFMINFVMTLTNISILSVARKVGRFRENNKKKIKEKESTKET
ncbi:uncharacterized protein LOC105279408 [Ooceraea biroi]|uniref:uncharacterized protein LOC105279408 n=1 Tax=Ooceraea biroi TaxID=2015173 RepID=UPI000F08B8E1|nr:uncharacterized protein LOC105279408 [Ooceraea biroi]